MQIFCKENFSLPFFFAICTSIRTQATHRLPAFRIVRTMLLSHLLPLDGVGLAETVTNNNKEIQVIPDAIQDGTMYEIKDTKAVYNT